MTAVQPLPPVGIENCAASVPPIVTVGSELATSPSFKTWNWMVWGVLTVTALKLLVPGESRSEGLDRQIPETWAVAVPPPISVSESVASFDPGMVGTNCTVTVHMALATRICPEQLSATILKSVVDITGVNIIVGAWPVFCAVNCLVIPGTLCCTDPKSNMPGDRTTALGLMHVPES